MKRISFNLIISITIGNLISCGKPFNEIESSNQQRSSSKGTHQSPFVKSKVVFQKDSFSQADGNPQSSSSDWSPQLRTTKPKLEVTVIINNSCAAKACASNTDAAESSLACRLFKADHNPNMLNMDQFYTSVLTESKTPSQIEEDLNSNEVDAICVVGISELKRLKAQTNDTSYNMQQSNMNLINYSSGILHFSGTLARVKVAVIDSGVKKVNDLNVPLANKVDMRESANKETCPAHTANLDINCNSHGTQVASVIGAVAGNSLGIAGIAPNVDLFSLTVGNGAGGNMTSTEIGNAMLYAIYNQGVEVINLSLGGEIGDNAAIRHAFTVAINEDVIVVAAAGNSSRNLDTAHKTYPAAYAIDYPNVISVAAVDSGVNIATFSNYGKNYVTMAAPGVSVAAIEGPISATNLNPFVSFVNGTSFAAPMVTAAVALALGKLKGKVDFDLGFVKELVSHLGANPYSSLNLKVNTNALLDLNKLGAYIAVLDTTQSTARLTIGQPIDTADPLEKKYTVNWVLDALHKDTRVGVFDSGSGCTISEPCVIQSFPVDSKTGTATFTINRNSTAPMSPDLKDPNFGLKLMVAVYHKVPIFDESGTIIGYKNIYAVDASRAIDIRAIDNSTSQSKLIGTIENIRMDMQHVYINGWTCFEGDNMPVRVALLNASSQPIASKYVYTYPWMLPHSGVLDFSKWGWTGAHLNRVTDWSLARSKPMVADDIGLNFGLANSHLAGHEANPMLMSSCKTLTASHGFEFVVPRSKIQIDKLGGSLFSVKATHRGGNLDLQDSAGRVQLRFPQVRDSIIDHSQISVVRGNSNVLLGGNLCAASPSPIEVEVSYNHWDFRIAATGAVNPEVNLFAEPFLHHPTLGTEGVSFFSFKIAEDPGFFVPLLKLNGKRNFTDKFHNYYVKATRKPNATVTNYRAERIPWINDYGFQEVTSGRIIEFERGRENKIAMGASLDLRSQVNATIQDYPFALGQLQTYNDTDGAFHMHSLKNFWDWYDVGNPFSSVLIGYTINKESTVGSLLSAKYGGIKEVLREIKKFETPKAAASVILGHKGLDSTIQSCGPGSGYTHNLNLTIQSIDTHVSLLDLEKLGWFYPEEPPSFVDIETVRTTMGRVPLTLRFFQDGKMILHLESDFQSNFRKITYPF